MSVRALLDINVLIALLDAGHVHHRAASDWLARNISHGWASCPITQNGCIRVMSQPGYRQSLPAGEVAARLAEATRAPYHAFWGGTLSLLDPDVVRWRSVLGSRQVTDAYLLALAVRNAGRFATFDRGVPLEAVVGAEPGHLELI